MSRLSLVRSRESYQGVGDALKIFREELEEKLRSYNEIIIKINFVTTANELATTPVNAVKAFIKFIRPFYNGKIIIAEEATIGDADEGFERYGFTKLKEIYDNIEIINTAKTAGESVEVNYGKGSISVSVAKLYLNNPYIVSIVRPKTHDTVVITAAIKNVLIGAIKHGKNKDRFKINHDKTLNYFMAEFAATVYPAFSIIDGTTGMEGQGPDAGDPVNSGWVTASFDALAADSLTAYLMGFKIKDIGYLNLLSEKKFGQLYPNGKLEIIGERPDELCKPFKPHTSFSSQKNWR